MARGHTGRPHRPIRRGCKWCPRSGHNHTRLGNTDRFHGIGSFCFTHSTTRIGRIYCSKGRPRRRIRRIRRPRRR